LEDDFKHQTNEKYQLHRVEVEALKKTHLMEMENLRTKHQEKVTLSKKQRLKIIEYGEKIHKFRSNIKESDKKQMSWRL
jgi:hypothetical protein